MPIIGIETELLHNVQKMSRNINRHHNESFLLGKKPFLYTIMHILHWIRFVFFSFSQFLFIARRKRISHLNVV